MKISLHSTERYYWTFYKLCDRYYLLVSSLFDKNYKIFIQVGQELSLRSSEFSKGVYSTRPLSGAIWWANW